MDFISLPPVVIGDELVCLVESSVVLLKSGVIYSSIKRSLEGKDMNNTIEDLKVDVSRSAQKGYPLLLSGAIFFLMLASLVYVIPKETLHLIWVIGLGFIFPFGILLGKLLKIDIMSNTNPLATLGGIAGGMQAFFIPVFIMVYQNNPEWLPFTVGLLGASHFLIYYWIYISKAYLFVSIATGLAALISGGYFIETTFVVTPILISAIYFATVIMILKENKNIKK